MRSKNIPEQKPSRPPLTEPIKRRVFGRPSLEVSVKPSFGPGVVMSLELSEPGEQTIVNCSVNGLYLGRVDARYCHRLINQGAWEQQVSTRTVESIRKTLQVPVSMTPRLAFGFDGSTDEVRFRAGSNAVQYKWWGRTPRGWEPLARLVRQLARLVRVSAVLQQEWP